MRIKGWKTSVKRLLPPLGRTLRNCDFWRSWILLWLFQCAEHQPLLILHVKVHILLEVTRQTCSCKTMLHTWQTVRGPHSWGMPWFVPSEERTGQRYSIGNCFLNIYTFTALFLFTIDHVLFLFFVVLCQLPVLYNAGPGCHPNAEVLCNISSKKGWWILQ